MNEALVKLDNHLAWDGIRQPFHEVYYLKLNDTNGKWSLWLRYAFTIPAPDNPGGTASLWAIYTEKNGKKITLRKDYDMRTHDVVHADQFIQIDNSNLSLAGCAGSIVSEKNTIKWELAFEDPVVSLRLYPYKILYDSSFPPSKVVSPRLLGFVTGTLYVENKNVGHKKINLFRNRIHQGHIYGSGLANQWAWANCIDFAEDTEAYFEAITAVMPWRGKVIRPLHLFCVGMEGEQFIANSLLKMVWQNLSDYDFQTWHCEFKKSGYHFDCTIRRDLETIVGVTYKGPNAETRHCYNSMLADIEIKVHKRKRGTWQDYKLLTSKGKCAFETVSPGVNPAVPILL